MTKRILLCAVVSAMAGCGGDDGGDAPVGSRGGDGKADASLEATFLEFEWDGEALVPNASSARWYIEDQMLYTMGHLNGDRSLGRLDKLELEDLETSNEGTLTLVRYHARMPVAWGKKNAVPTSYTLRLPRDATAGGLERFTALYKEDCVDWSAHDVDAGSMWYYYRPGASGCRIADEDLSESIATVRPSTLQTTGRYPEYDQVWEDGALEVVAIFGKNEHGATSSSDAGVSAYNQFVRQVRTLLTGATVTTVPAEVPTAPGVAMPDVTFEATLSGSRRIKIVAMLVDAVREPPEWFDDRYAALTPTADVISYAGHSGLGANIRALASKGEWRAGQYVVVLMNGCDSYAYVDRALWRAHAAVNPGDPEGTKHTDILMNAMPSFFHSNAANVRTLISGLLDRDAPKTFEQIFGGFDAAQVVLVSGEEDNTYVPGDGGGGTDPWDGLDETGTVARQQEVRFETPSLAPGRYRFEMTGTNDADLYVRIGTPPSTTLYDCRPYRSGSDESCSVDLPTAAPIHVMIRGYATSSEYQLVGRPD